MPDLLVQVLLGSGALLGAFIVVRGCWFEAPEVRKLVVLTGLVACSGAVMQLLAHEGSAWRWPARVLFLAAMIAMVFVAPRSVWLPVWLKLRWVLVGGIGTMFGLVVTMLLPNMSPVARAIAVAFVVGMAVLFFVSLVRFLVRTAATQRALRSGS